MCLYFRALKSEVTDLQKNNELFQEMLIQKDRTIMTLTNEVFELETDKQNEKRKNSTESVKSDSPFSVPESKDSLSMDELKVIIYFIHFCAHQSFSLLQCKYERRKLMCCGMD